jgi:pimeloyl-ACP methyl ester carboxylesterase
MLIRDRVISAALFSLLAVGGAIAQTAAIPIDPTPDKAAPAAMQSFQLPSHGALLNAFVYIASGAGPHPVVLLLHGFPGNERNLDLAQVLRRAGYDVLYFNYRGSWGSPGNFSLGNSIEDTVAAIAYMRVPANAAKFRADPKKIVLVGHSMGGFMALNAGAQDAAVSGIITISAGDMATRRLGSVPAAGRDAAVKTVGQHFAAEGMAPLAGCTPEGIALEAYENASKWNFVSLAPKLASRPMLVITSDDGLATASDELVAALHKLGDVQVKTAHIADDHAYSASRISLAQQVVDGLAAMHLQ